MGDTNNIVTAMYKGKSGKAENVFWNVEVKDLEHEYPNGKNHPFYAAPYHWNWMKQYTLDGTFISSSICVESQ